jgi:AcrR family transcriptional regulator
MILNVRSASDLHAQARIREAAIEVFGREGFDRATVRAIAARAGVSAALVLHHYGSKDGLRQACDDAVMQFVRSEKMRLITGGPQPQLADYLREHPEISPITAYIASALRHDGPIAQAIFDRMCEITGELIEAGVRSGTMRDLPDREAVSALLVAYAAGEVLFGEHIARRLGGATIVDPDVSPRYQASSTAIFTDGLLTSGETQ